MPIFIPRLIAQHAGASYIGASCRKGVIVVYGKAAVAEGFICGTYHSAYLASRNDRLTVCLKERRFFVLFLFSVVEHGLGLAKRHIGEGYGSGICQGTMYHARNITDSRSVPFHSISQRNEIIWVHCSVSLICNKVAHLFFTLSKIFHCTEIGYLCYSLLIIGNVIMYPKLFGILDRESISSAADSGI